MKIHLIKKEKGRVYKSEDIVRALFGAELAHDGNGAPFLRAEEGAEERFVSITDTKNYWACAVEGSRIGLDMEEAGRVVKPAVAKRFHKDEQAYLAALSEGSREWTEEFLSIWTRKEAWAKYCGKGLKQPFSEFSVLDGALPAPVSSFAYKNLVFGIAGAPGAEVVTEKYDAPMEQSALDYAAGLLDSRAYSSAALKKKLLDRGYREEESEAAIEKLKDYGYINDESYAAEFARRAAEGGKGSRRISFELKEKGIDKELAAQAASEYKEGEYGRALDIARAMAEKSGSSVTGPANDPDPADLSDLSPDQKKELFSRKQKLAGKISRKLSSLGYDASVIYSVLEDLGL